jgi:phospholipid/cholesterol/gamma-HCH transport system substrate-binding protein
METRANHVLIGLFTILVTLLAVMFALWAANYASNRNWDRYEVVFTEAVTGLGNGGIVQYNGINVGEVERLRLDPQDPRKVIARIRLQADTPVKIDTKAKLAFIGLTGVAQIQLSGGTPESPRLLPTLERPVPIIPTQPSALQNISEAASDIGERVRLILSDANIQKISKMIENLNQISGTVAAQKDDVAALIHNLRDATANLNTTLVKAQGSLDTIDKNVVQQLPELMKRLDHTLAQLDAATTNANGLISENREPLSNFTQNGLSQVGPTMVELRGLTRDIRQLVNRVNRNPGGYLTGRTRPEEFDPKTSKESKK